VDERKMRQQIRLGQQHEIGLLEHLRKMQRFLLTLGDRQRDDVERLTEVADGAEEIAAALDEEILGVAGVEMMQRALHELGIERSRPPHLDRLRSNAR